MRRLAILPLAALLLAACARGEDKKDGTNGTWLVTGFEVAGKKATDEELKKGPSKLTLADGKFTVVVGDMSLTGTYKVDTSKTPHTVDVTHADGPHKGETWMGIAEVKGDTMRACYDTTGKSRPTSFDTKDKPGFVCVEYKRGK
jgi:uncharacterized protein (TIGR03067 family)